MIRESVSSRYPGAGTLSRIILITMLVITVGVAIAAPLSYARWVSAPYPGVLTHYGLRVDPFLTRKLLDIEPDAVFTRGARITAVDGYPVHDGNSLTGVLSAHDAGDEVSLTIVAADGQEHDVDIILQGIPAFTTSVILIVMELLGLAFVAAGFYIYRGLKRKPLGWLFFGTYMSMAVLFLCFTDSLTSHWLVRIWITFLPISAAFLFMLFLVYPSDKRITGTSPFTRWIPMMVGLLLAVLGQIFLSPSNGAIVLMIAMGTLAVSIFTFFTSLLVYVLFSQSPTMREQGQLLLGGMVLGMIPMILWLFDLMNLSSGWISLPLLLIPAVMAYTVMQYSPLVSRRILSYTLTYSIMGIMISLGYALLIAGTSLISVNFLPGSAQYPVLIGLYVFLLALIFEPAKTRIQDWLDGIFYRKRVDFDQQLSRFRHSLTRSRELSDILALVRKNLEDILQPQKLYIYLREPESDIFTSVGERHRDRSDIQFDTQSGLVHTLTSNRDLLFLEMDRPLPPELVEEKAQLGILDTQILAPLQGQDRLVGWIAVGEKNSGERFSLEELYYVQSLTEQVSLAVERAQVIDDLERRVSELDVLSQVSQAINLTDDPGVLMGVIHTQLTRVLDATNFSIIMHDDDTETFHYEYNVIAGSRADTTRSQSWPDKEGLASVVYRSGRPLRTDNYVYECRRRGLSTRGVNISSWMGVPLNVGADVIGVMVITSSIPEMTFSEEDLRFFWSLGDQAAVTLEKLRLFRETETRAQQLAMLNESSRELTTTLDLDFIFENTVSAAVKMLDTEAGSLFLLDEEADELLFRVVQGGDENLVGTKIPADKGIVGEAVRLLEPVVVDDVIRDHRWYSQVDRSTDIQTQRMLAVPFISQDKVLGVLEVINKKDNQPFTDEDKSLLATFATQAAAAIENARLYQATDEALAEKVSELEVLMRIDRDLSRTLEYQDVVDITLDWALKETGATSGAILMLDEEEEGFWVEAARGYSEEFMAKYEDFPVDYDIGIFSKAMDSGEPVFVKDVQSDELYIQATEKPTAEEIVIPFIRLEEPVGVLVLESDEPGSLTDRCFNFSQQIAEHAGIAIENARLVGAIEQANHDKSQFISFVAHELKNPMTTIRGYTDLIKGGGVGEVSDMQGQFLGTIRQNIDRMTRLVSDLSDSARIETGNMRLEKDMIKIRTAIDEAVSGLRGQIEDKSQTLKLNVDADLPYVSADSVRMGQVMTNLLSNAMKYTPEGGSIEIGAEAAYWEPEEGADEVEALHVWVEDTGIGISEEDLDQLFTKFFRTTRAKDMASGTGLGMMITRSLIEAHGGELWVESVVNEGSTFHFIVPFNDPEAE